MKTEMSGLPSGLDLYRIQIKNRTEVTMFILMGFTDDSEMPNLSLFTISSNLSFYNDRKFGVGFLGRYGFPAPQPHVLFSDSIIILGCLLFFCYHPPNADQFPIRE